MATVGSIPACAGEPVHRPAQGACRAVYPRVCGGTRIQTGDRFILAGLSPRVRGNLRIGTRRNTRGRSIPACAGEPRAAVEEAMGETVYPRVCGGTTCNSSLAIPVRGLSPRVRGNLQSLAALLRLHRSIPACAGEPYASPRAGACHPVYPRVCGGTAVYRAAIPTPAGLSPRVRGNRRTFTVRLLLARSIPACAGEPQLCKFGVGGHRVYPRVCGGTLESWQSRATCWGLSPRVRGNRPD